jgi:hypothetical protein
VAAFLVASVRMVRAAFRMSCRRTLQGPPERALADALTDHHACVHR